MTDRLSVWWDGRISGCLYLGSDGETLFAYDAEWLADPKAPALSFSLPKQAEPFKRSAVQAFFGGILPEEGQRTAIARALGQTEKVAKMLDDMPQVVEAHRVTGADCFVAKVVVSDLRELESVVDCFVRFASTHSAIIQ